MANTTIPVELSSTPGIVDNSNATAITIDSSENVLVGKTATAFGTAGIEARSGGTLWATASETNAASFNRLSTDGAIAYFNKDGTTVGSIGTAVDGLYIADSGVGFRFDSGGTDDIIPCNATGAASDGTINLGSAGARFNDLYLSSKVKLQASGGNQHSVGVDTNDFVIRSETAGTETARFTYGGNLLVKTTTAGTKTGDGVIAFGAAGGVISNFANPVANNGTLDIAINTGGGGYQGFLSVANTNLANAAVRTQTTFSVFGRSTDSSIQQIATDTGPTSAATFTVTTPSNGVIRVTNTSGSTTVVSMQFFGGTSG
jgi:hypothetical protein